MTMESFTKGTCMGMCPQQEIKLREAKGILHLLETDQPEGTRRVNLRANRRAVVKCFQRPAAGLDTAKLENVRPPEILATTVHHLLNRVICDKRLPYSSIYDFVTDRLRAVRQDMTIQQPPPACCIPLLEPMVRFHAYSAYRLGSASLNDFDPVLNHKHLLECLKWVLSLYDKSQHLSEARLEMETTYVLLNLGDFEALQRSVSLPKNIRNGILLKAEQISLSWCLGNYYRVCKEIMTLPVIHSVLAAATQLPHIRRFTFSVLSSAYSSKNLTYPLLNLSKILLYNTAEEVVLDCKHYGLSVEGDSVHFLKSKFISQEKKVVFRTLFTIDKSLMLIPIPELLLSNNMYLNKENNYD